jgi:hypothetical protein
MRRIGWIIGLTAAVFVTAWHAGAFEPPAIPFNVKVSPVYADRLFPYIEYQRVWQGTPAQRDDVAIPAVAFVCGKKENSRVVSEAGRMAFYLGVWCEDVGFGVKNVMEKGMPSLVVVDADLTKTGVSNFIVAGTNNTLVSRYGIRFEGPSVLYREADGRKFLFAGGKTEEDTINAIRYLADIRLNFKAGAYKTFFNFVRLRGYLEAENWDAALETIESPEGLSACGRNMALASPMMSGAPEKVKTHVKHRNRILYGLLPKAVMEKKGDRATQLWRDAMKKCYGCHQGQGGIPRLRRFVPMKTIHAKHQRISGRFPSTDSCTACHSGETRVRGYD